MGSELVPFEPAFVAELYEAHVDATYDAYIDVLPADDMIVVETQLEAADEEALEMGIISIFDELRAEAEEEPIFTLLAELNRMWAEPLAA